MVLVFKQIALDHGWNTLHTVRLARQLQSIVPTQSHEDKSPPQEGA